MDLGQLVVELVGDYSQLLKDIEDAKKEAIAQARKIEKNFSNNFKIKLTVDQSGLVSLNNHLDLKVSHLKATQNYFNRNPLKIKVDQSELTQLNQEITKLKSGKVNVSVSANYSGDSSRSKESAPITQGEKEIVKGLRSLESKTVEKQKKSFSQSIGTGIAEEFGSTIGRNLMSGFKKNLGVDVAGMTRSFTRAVSKPLAKVNPQSIREFEDRLVGALEEAFVFKNEEAAKTKFKAAFQPIVDEIQEVALTAAGQVVKVGAQPLRIRKRVMLAQSMLEAEQMSKNIQVSNNQEIQKAKSIALITGGIDYQKGGANTFFAENLVKRILPGAYSVPVTNPYSNDFKNLGALYELTKSFSKGLSEDNDDNKPMPLDMLLHTGIEKGYNPDSVKMAAEAMAYRKAHPDKPLILGGTSGGSYVVEEAIGILERAGIKNVKGLGITAPVNNLMTVASPENYQANVGEFDPLNLAMFGSKNVINKDHPIYKETKKSMSVSLPGLLEESELMKVIPLAGKGHALLPFLTKPEFQSNIQSFLGDYIDPISPSFRGMRAEPNLHFYRQQNDERNVIARTIKAVFGDSATLKQIAANNFNGAEGYTFAVPQKPGWRRDNDFRQMRGNLPSIKNIGKDIRPEFEEYTNFLEEMQAGLASFLDSGAKVRQSMLSTLDKAVKFYPELKEVQKRVIETLNEQTRLLELQKLPIGKDSRSPREKYRDATRLARINAEFPKGQQYLKDKRNAELDAALPQAAKDALLTAREIASEFNKGYAKLKNLVEEGKTDEAKKIEAVNLARIIKESAISSKSRISDITKNLGNDSAFGTRLGSQLAQTQGQIGSVQKKTEQLLAKNKISLPSKTVSDSITEAKKAGENVVKGFSEGINSQISDLKKASESLANIPVDVIKDELEIQSPSKVMEQLGRWTAEGFAKGLETIESLDLPEFFKKSITELKEIVLEFANGALSVSKFSEAFQKISGAAKIGVAAIAGMFLLKTLIPIFSELSNASIETAIRFEGLERRIRFTSGGISEGTKNLKFLREEAKRLNVDLGQTLESGASFLQATQGTSLEGEPSRQVVSAMTQASSVYTLDTLQQERSFKALEQIAGKTVVSQEELRQQLAEAIPNAAQIAARAYGTTAQSLNEIIKSGRALSEDFLPKFSQQMLAETYSGVAAASDSSLGVTNKFNNALTELQESIGKTLLPFRNFSLGTIADSINFLVKNGEILKTVFTGVLIVFGAKAWRFFGSYLLSISSSLLSLVANARSAQLAVVGITNSLVSLAKYYAIAVIATESLRVATANLTDQSGDIGKQVRSQTQAIYEYKKAIGQKVENPNEGFSGFLKQIKNPFDFAVNRKEAKDTIDAIKNSYLDGFKIIESARSKEVAKSIKDVALIDKQLETVQIRRRSLIQREPKNLSGLRELESIQSELLKKRQEALKPAAGSQKLIDVQIESIKSQLEYLKNLKSSGVLIYEKEISGVDKIISDLEKSLKLTQDEQVRIKNSIKDTLTELQLFENGWQDISSNIEDSRKNLEKMLTLFSTNLSNKETFGIIKPGEADFTKNLEAQSVLALKIAKNIEEIQQKTAELNSQDLDTVLNAVNLNKNSGIADIRKQEQRSLDGTKEQLILKSYGDLKELEISTIDLQQQLADQKVSTVRQLYESNKSISDWLESIMREAEELQLSFRVAIKQIKTDKAKSKLKSALIGFQDNFVGQFVDSLINIIETLNQPIQEMAQIQSQILQNTNRYKDIIRQKNELERNLPQQYFDYSARNGYGEEISKGVIRPVNGPITSGFGTRKRPTKGASTFHPALDFGVPIGTPVKAPTSGIITGAKGDVLTLESIDKLGNKIVQQFLHLDSFSKKIGDVVKQGDIIARSGNKGISTGPHLDWRIKVNGKFIDPLVFEKMFGSQDIGVKNIGITSTPQANNINWMKTIASTYGAGDGFDGQKTSSGEIFRKNGLTAAINENLKKQLGIQWGDMIEAINPETGKRVTVRVNDHGPYEKQNGRYVPHSTRGIDLSTEAARQIGISLGEVQFRVVGKNPKITENSKLVQLVENLRKPVVFGQGPGFFNNDAKRALEAGAEQAAINLQTQNENVLLKLRSGTSKEMSQIEAMLQQSRANFQLRDNIRDVREEVIRFQRTREDQGDEIGFQTPRRELETRIRNLRRTFRDSDSELIKSEERLTAVVGTAEKTLDILKSINPSDLPEGFDLQNAILKITELLPSAKSALSKVTELINSNTLPARNLINDAINKFNLEEEARRNESDSAIKNGWINSTRQQAERASLLAERSLIGDYSKGDSILLGLQASDMEISNKYSQTINALNSEMLTGEASRKYGDAAEQTISYLKKSALRELLRSLDVLRIQGERDLLDRDLSDKEEAFGARERLIQSQNSLLSATKDGYSTYGLNYYSKGFAKEQAMIEQQLNYERESLEIEKLAASGRYAAEYIEKLKNNLNELNSVNLKNIDAEFSLFSDVIKGVKSDTENVFKDFLLNAESFESSLLKIFESILNNLASLASQMLSDQLFGSIFGKGGFKGQSPSFGGNGMIGGVLGGISNIFGVGNITGTSDLFGWGDLFGGGNATDFLNPGGSFGILGFSNGGMVGEISRSMKRERALSGREPRLIVANTGERILNPEETQIWNRIQQNQKISNYSDGGTIGKTSNLSNQSSSSQSMFISMPINISGGGEGSGYDLPQLTKILEAKIQQTIKQERRPGGTLSDAKNKKPYNR